MFFWDTELHGKDTELHRDFESKGSYISLTLSFFFVYLCVSFVHLCVPPFLKQRQTMK